MFISRRDCSRIGLVLLAACIALIAVSHTQAAIPQVKTATLQKQYLAHEREFNERTLLEAYKKVGKHDPKWDKEAEVFLADMAKYWSSGEDMKPGPKLDRLVVEGKKAIDAGCDDPMVGYCYARIRDNSSTYAWQSKEKYAHYLMATIEPLAKLGYPSGRVFNAMANNFYAARDADFSKDMIERLLKRTLDAMIPMLQDAKGRKDQRIIADWMSEFIDAGNDPDAVDQKRLNLVIKRIKGAKGIDPWLKHLSLGYAQTELAWVYRGSGWAGTVNDQGWNRFAQHLKLARKQLTQAYKIDPSVPEAATKMIQVCMGESGNSLPEMRQWFDRAVKAEFDYWPAYTKLEWGLRPRWGGSHNQLYAFGMECMNTHRYDTAVPRNLMYCLWDIRDDLWRFEGKKARWRYWRRPGVYANIKQVEQGYIKRPLPGHDAQYYRAELAVFAYCCGRYDEVLRIYRQLGDHVDPKAMVMTARTWPQIVAEAAAKAGPLASKFQNALNLARSGKMTESLKAYQKIAAGPLQIKPLKKYIADRVRTLKWRIAFDQGKTIDLMAGKGLIGWTMIYGHWERDAQGRFVGHSTSDGLALQLMGNFGPSWEMTGRVEALPSKYGAYHSAIFLGDMSAFSPLMVVVDPTGTDNKVDVKTFHGDVLKRAALPSGGPDYNFKVRLNHGIVSVWINKNLIIDKYRIEHFDQLRDRHLGIGGYYWFDDQNVAFSNLKLRRVSPTSHAAGNPAARTLTPAHHKQPRLGPPPAPR